MDDIRLAMIGTALDFIETHLEDGVALADVAQAAHYSKYHLHRAFSGILGITAHQYAGGAADRGGAPSCPFPDAFAGSGADGGLSKQQAFSDAFCAMLQGSAGGIPSPARFLSAAASHPPESRSPLIRHPSGGGRGYPGLDGASWSGGGMGIPGWTRPGTFPGSRLESRGERPSSSAAETGRQARSVFAALPARSTIWPFIRSTVRWEYPCSCSRPCDAGFLRSVS